MLASSYQTFVDRSAAALDSTHGIGECGPRTYLARQRVATALDSGARPLLADVKWLEWAANQAEQAA